jgi:hypothetical protein
MDKVMEYRKGFSVMVFNTNKINMNKLVDFK